MQFVQSVNIDKLFTFFGFRKSFSITDMFSNAVLMFLYTYCLLVMYKLLLKSDLDNLCKGKTS